MAGSFNNLDGNNVAEDLRHHEELWHSIVLGFEHQSLTEVRDLPPGVIAAAFIRPDTIYVLTSRNKFPGLLDLMQRWEADEVGWLSETAQEGPFGNKSAFDLIGTSLGPDDMLVRVWWA